MASRILLESLHLEENVFELTEASDMGLLIHFAAPFTGVEISSIPAGIKFAINGPMRDDAFYLHVVNNNDDDKKNIDTLFETLDKVVEDKYPKLFDRLIGYSFYITEEQVKIYPLSFSSGSRERVVDAFELIREENRNLCRKASMREEEIEDFVRGRR